MNAGAVSLRVYSDLSSMSVIVNAFSFLAISQLLLMGLYYLGFYHQHLIARLLALLCLCLISAVVWAPSILGGSFIAQCVLLPSERVCSVI